MALRLNLEPVKQGGQVTGCKLSFTTKGGGDLPADGKHEAAIEFFEVAGKGDKAVADRKIGTLAGTLTLTKGQPRFQGTSIRYEPLVEHTDFYLNLVWPEAQWEAMEAAPQLKLPWEVDVEGDKQEVGARLVVDEEVLADVAANKPIDVPLKHKSVPDDGTSAKKRFTGWGVEAVYPVGNALLGDSDRIPIGDRALKVFVHAGVQDHLDRLVEGGFKLPVLAASLKRIFATGGFNKVDVELKSDADAKTLWKRVDERWVASKMNTAPAVFLKAGTEDPKEGNDVHFFDHWVFHEKTVIPTWGEVGEAEILNGFAPVNVAAATKRVMLPTVLVGQMMDGAVAEAESAQNGHDYIANTIAHEIGHALGLRHCLYFDGSDYSKLTNGLGVMSQLNSQGGDVVLKRFSPVERATLAKHYL